MFVRGMGMGDYTTRSWKVEDWLPQAGMTQTGTSLVPGVSNTTTTVVGGTLGLAALAAAAWWLFKK